MGHSANNQSLNSIRDLGCKKNIEVINEFVSLDGKFVIDAGCGSMIFSEQVAEAGAQVLAIDPDPLQAKINRETSPIPNIRFEETGADALSVDDHSVDGVFFSYSLHHIPAEIYPQVFGEVFRVLKPDGFLYVIEPIDCPLNEVMMLFHNEQAERAAAQTALNELAVPAFEYHEVVTYHSISEFDSFDHFATHFGSRTFNPDYTEADVRAPAVREAFERLAGQPKYRFEAPKVVMFLEKLKTS